MSTLAHPISPPDAGAATALEGDSPAHEVIDHTLPVGRPSDTAQAPGTVQTDALTGEPIAR
ncbi:MAG: hypothetical protein V4505_26325 [Pseudomonadota bacterium]